MKPLSNTRIVELDGVRGVACIFVLVHHFFTGVLAVTLPQPLRGIEMVLAPLFLSGVDLFYVLSGFLVGGIILDHHRDANFLRVFYIRRVCRIFPVYFALMLSFFIAAHFLSAAQFPWLLLNPIPTWSYFTFLQSYFMGAIGVWPHWVGIAWSVSVEEQFYVLMPFMMLLIHPRGALRFALVGVVVAPIVRILVHDHVGVYTGYMWFPARFDTILWGMLLAYTVRNAAWLAIAQRHLNKLLALAVVLFAMVILSNKNVFTPHPTLIYTYLAIFYAVMMLAVLLVRFPRFNAVLRSRFLTFSGLISYGMYMYHQAINGLVHKLAYGNDSPGIRDWQSFGLTVGSVLLVYALGTLSFRYFEDPIRRIGHRHHYRAAK